MPLFASGVSRDGFEFRIYIYPDESAVKVIVRISNGILEVWNITGEAAEYPLWSIEEEALHPILDKIVEKFTFDGVEKTLALTIGGKQIVGTVRINDKNILFSRITTENRVGKIVEAVSTGITFLNATGRPPPVVRPISPRKMPAPTQPKEQLGLGNEAMRKLRQIANHIIAETGIKAPSSIENKIVMFINMLDIKFKTTPRTEAMKNAIHELVKWFEDKTQPKA